VVEVMVADSMSRVCEVDYELRIWGAKGDRTRILGDTWPGGSDLAE
jgi:hypothetical protein